MSTTTKDLLRAAATVVFAIAAAATSVTNAFAAADDAEPATIAAEGTAPAATAPAQGLTRAEVRAQAIAALKDGTLPQTEVDFDVARTRKHIVK